MGTQRRGERERRREVRRKERREVCVKEKGRMRI